jgi:hypothetical protein
MLMNLRGAGRSRDEQRWYSVPFLKSWDARYCDQSFLR